MNYLIPEFLETDRLILRTFRENDWKDLHAYYSDEECIRYTIGSVLNSILTQHIASHIDLRLNQVLCKVIAELASQAGTQEIVSQLKYIDHFFHTQMNPIWQASFSTKEPKPRF